MISLLLYLPGYFHTLFVPGGKGEQIGVFKLFDKW